VLVGPSSPSLPPVLLGVVPFPCVVVFGSWSGAASGPEGFTPVQEKLCGGMLCMHGTQQPPHTSSTPTPRAARHCGVRSRSPTGEWGCCHDVHDSLHLTGLSLMLVIARTGGCGSYFSSYVHARQVMHVVI